jgi:hypothetical protein
MKEVTDVWLSVSKLSDLHDRGVISDAEFAQGKQKILQ